ncbi:MAG: hypothetical protein DRJ07_18300 [Bacteroidetes bacterium]|nr:MAG: hypothetical protein DRJ07_18300 [Bacteroidota bacterium]
MSLFKRKPKEVGGVIGAWGLSEWWLSEFTVEEQNQLVDKLVKSDMFQRGNIYTKGEYYYDISELPGELISLPRRLISWATFVQKPETRHIAYKLANMAESLINDQMDIVDLYFYYHNKIGVYYRNRNEDPDSLDIAIEACKKQIEIAPDAKAEMHKRDLERFGETRYDIGNVGFKQLRIIEEKRGNYQEALKLSHDAKKQRWAGNWDKDIERLHKKLNKTMEK